jgi:hypothetical protein
LPKVRFGPAAGRAAIVGLVAYGISLLATMPAALIVAGAGGSIWSGSARLPVGHRLEWHWQPMQSLFGLGFGVAWRIEGPESELSGEAVLRPGRAMIAGVSGALDLALPFALVEDIPFACQAVARVDVAALDVGPAASMAEGKMRTAAGQCRSRGANGVDRSVPAMVLRLARTSDGGSAVRLTTADPAQLLMTGTLGAGNSLRYSLTPAGARTLPFAAPPGGAGQWVEMQF